MEYFDVYNADGSPAHRKAERGIVHAEGLWHRTVHIWVHRPVHSLLFQKRALNKDSHPGLWDVSAAGHIDGGEHPEQAALREMKEELGLNINVQDLTFVEMTSRSLVSNGGTFIDNEFSFVYLYRFAGNESELKPDPEEVAEIRFIETGKLRAMLDSTRQRRSFVPYDRSYYDTIIAIVEEQAQK
jgi:isopentenyldiphosphate isomerase